MNRSTSRFIVGFLVGILTSCLGFAWLGQVDAESPDSSKMMLTVAHALPVSHPVHKGLEHFGHELHELSGGTMSISIYPSGQLGNETECLEKIQQGGIDIAKVSTAPIGNFAPVFRLFSLPYLFRDRRHYWNILDGPIGADLLQRLGTREDGEPTGLVGLGYYDAGSRSFYTTRPVTRPTDLEGMKIRVQQDPVAADTVKAMGASAVAMPFGELYTALKQGGVDGAENNPPSFLSSRHFEVCDHYVLDSHSRIPDVLVGSGKLWNNLNDAQRGWIEEAIKRSSLFQRTLWKEESELALQTLEANGVTVHIANTPAFREAAEVVMEKHATGERATLASKIKATP